MASWEFDARQVLMVLALGGLWTVNIGLSEVREQEPVVRLPRAVSTERGRQVSDARETAMEVAVANTLLDEGQAREAWTIYRETIEEAHEESGRVASVSHDFAQEKEWSVAELVHADFSPEEREAIIDQLLSQANAQLEQGEYDGAVDVFERVFILDPLNAKASKGIDRARKSLVRARRAKEEILLERVREENRAQAQDELERARTLMRQGSLSEAKAHLERVLLVDPGNREARRLLKQVD